MMLQNILADEKPTHILVAWDAGKTTFRHTTFGEYKGGRQKDATRAIRAIPLFTESFLTHINIPQYELDQYEADDIIGTLSKSGDAEGVRSRCHFRRQGLDAACKRAIRRCCITRKGMTDLEKYTPEHVMEKYGIDATCRSLI